MNNFPFITQNDMQSGTYHIYVSIIYVQNNFPDITQNDIRSGTYHIVQLQTTIASMTITVTIARPNICFNFALSLNMSST